MKMIRTENSSGETITCPIQEAMGHQEVIEMDADLYRHFMAVNTAFALQKGPSLKKHMRPYREDALRFLKRGGF